VLLCDEVTSSVDSIAEKDIVAVLRLASQRRTTITVAHRLSSVVDCDSIIVLEGGRVVEQGSHVELLTKGGIYADMWKTQHAHASSVPSATSTSIDDKHSPGSNDPANDAEDPAEILQEAAQETEAAGDSCSASLELDPLSAGEISDHQLQFNVEHTADLPDDLIDVLPTSN
jgi:ABC-type multidrug transport system ATPase subunit